MKISPHILFVALSVAITFPGAAFAAKGEPKNKKGQSLEETFAAIDQNKDGTLTQAEYLGVMKRVLGEEGAKARFAALDKNSDGKVTKEEFANDNAEPQKKRRKKNAN